MLPYFFLISIPSILAIAGLNKKSSLQKISLCFVGVLYILFIGLRHEVGADWVQYSFIFENIKNYFVTEGFTRSEPGYTLLNFLVSQVGGDIYGVNLCAASIFVTGMFVFAARMPMPWLAIVSVTPYLIIVVGMSGVRQATAIGLVFLLLAGWRRNSNVKNILIALLATSFHYSAFIAVIFVLANVKMMPWLKWTILVIGGVICFDIFTQTDQYAVYEERYAIKNVVSSGAVQHVLLNVIPSGVYLILIKKWDKKFGRNQLMRQLSVLCLLSLGGVFVSSTAIDRLALYLSPIQMLVYGSMPVVFRNQALSFAIVFLHVAILYVWLAYANTSFAYLPYQSIIFNV